MIKQIRDKIFDISLSDSSTESEEHAHYGRNEPCWCGSGIKYKKCHLKSAPDESFLGNALLALAVLVPIISTYLGTQITYRSGNIASNSLWLWIVIAASVITGVICIMMRASLLKTKGAVMVLVYLPIILVVIWVIAFITACFNGDCL